MPPVAHLYVKDGPPTGGGVTSNRDVDPAPPALGSSSNSNSNTSEFVPAAFSSTGSAAADTTSALQLHRRPGSITEGDETLGDTDDGEGGSGSGSGRGDRESGESIVARAVEATGLDKDKEAEEEEVGAAAKAAAGKLLAATAKERQSAMSMSTVVLQEAKRNKRFKFFNEER